MARPRVDATANHGSVTAGAPRAKPKRKAAPRECPSSRRSSAYRGVTRHRWTGRFEAHLWDKHSWNHEPQVKDDDKKKKKKGRQVYLGAYDDEEAAARAHDLAALKYWGPGTVLNFPLCSYDEELKEMDGQSREEYIGSVRRKSSGFSRGVSKYRGVARHHHNGRWEARIGRVLGNKYLYLGTYATQEEAAVAYDIAAIEHRGLNAVTNFDIGHYVNWHRRRLCGEDGLDATGTKLPAADDLAGHARATTGPGDETVAATVSRAGDHHDQQYRIAGSSCAVQLPDDGQEAPPSSALHLLLQSPKFEEIMEQQVSAAAAATTTTGSNTSSSSPCTSSSSPSSLSRPSPERQPEELSGGASSSARCSFPDDVQTYFECDGGTSFPFAEVDMFLLGDLGSYAAPMFQCDVEMLLGPFE